jgi:hypothetical protein
VSEDNVVALAAHGGLPSTRREAKKIGSTQYFTGKPCCKGHIAPRFKRRAKSKDRYAKSDKGKKAKRDWRLKNPTHAWASTATTNAKRRAAEKGVPFDLISEYVETLVVDRCPVLGIALVYTPDSAQGPDRAALDRMIPELGYVRGNVQVLASRANMMKSDASPEELLLFANWVLRTPLKAAA